MRHTKNTSSYAGVRRTRRGFTLVELIVVLTIIAILAAIAVGSVVGYINKSRFDQNEQHAITVYQTAQTIVSQKAANGTLEDWIKGIPDITLPTLSTGDTQTDASAHSTVALTYNPNSAGNKEDAYIYSFLSPYFYDMSIFSGTLTVEFDISAINDNGVIVYSASVKSAFYSVQNSASSGWDPAYCSENGVKTEDGLPVRSISFRYLTSHVGYYDGTEGSAKPVNVTPVYLPQSTTYELDGHIVAGSDAQGYLFNFRNGETLDISWAIFDYDGRAHDVHNENFVITLFNADDNSQISTISIDWSENPATDYTTLSLTSDVTTTIERVNNRDVITRKTVEGTITAKVKTGSKTDTKTFPISISLVTGDGRIGCPDPNVGYYEYRLSLDCMMERSDEGNNSRYSFNRLMGLADNKPRNIYATISGSATYYTDARDADGNSVKSPLQLGGTSSEPVYAARAIDDPVYFDRIEVKNGVTTYIYTVRDNAAEGDEDDDHVDGKTITGVGVVNTLFGDLRYGRSVVTSSGGATETIYGSVWGDNNRDVLITAYRHLYNIRNVENKNITATFRIVRDLNWYSKVGDEYVSEVKVFALNQSYRFHSPAVGGERRTVSFPALGELKSGQTLMSMSVTGGATYSINNVQLRGKSFTSADAGYGLICNNLGTIYNIRTNNLNLVMTNYGLEGEGCDYSSISNRSAGTIGTSDSRLFTNNKPVGGLVGLNSGLVGSSSDLAESSNTIEMVNTIVMAGEYWSCGGYDHVGGVIGWNKGRNSESSYGVIRFMGSFAVLGGSNVGGIIGCDDVNIGARLVVEGSKNSTGISFSEITISNDNNSDSAVLTPACIVASKFYAGGAIGKITGTYEFTYDVSEVTVSGPDDTGELTFEQLDDDDYHISVSLSEDSLITGINSVNGHVGGAIGYFANGNGDLLNIRVRNSGRIIGQKSKARNYGGAIGYYEFTKATHVRTVYLDVDNAEGSSIGSWSEDSDYSRSLRAGGAIGLLNFTVNNDDYTLLINAKNDGLIVSSGNDFGAGGAIGAVTGNNINAEFIISSINTINSRIIGVWSGSGTPMGAGGAVGAIGSASSGSNVCISTDSIIYAENSGTVKGADYVGGAIGLVPYNNGKVYAVNNSVEIEGRNYVGGAAGYVTSHYGTIHSVLNGSTVSGYGISGYIGGASGHIKNYYDHSIVRVEVNADSSVSCTATGSNVGGVIGDVNIVEDITDGIIELQGDSTVPVLTVSSGGSQVGGAVGYLRSNVDNTISIKLPDQSPANGLVMRVNGANQVGGAIGYLYNSNQQKDIKIDLNVVLHPLSYIKGSGCNVGGAVGLISTEGGKYCGSIIVKSIMGTVSDGTSVIEGLYNVGGAVGRFNKCYPYNEEFSNHVIKTDFSLSPWSIVATGSSNNLSNVGGAIGTFESNTGDSSTAIPVTAMLGASSISGPGNNVGGAIGRNYMKNGTIYVSSTVGSSIHGANNVGGAIGSNESSVLAVTAQITGDVTGSSNVGGAIGQNKASVSGNIIASVTGNVAGSGNSIGGAVGYNNYNITYPITLNLTGKVSGASDVGGVIGFNDQVDISLSSSTSTVITATINGSVTGTGNNIGGAIGHTKNKTVTGIVSVTFQSGTNGTVNSITGKENVGGIIGFNESTTFVSGITANIPSGCKVEGEAYIGGAVGKNQGTLYTVQSTIDGVITGTGTTGYVSGAIGYNDKTITTVTATINANGKVQGAGDNVGGAIGCNAASVNTVTVNLTGSITGKGKVGGAVGYNKGPLVYISATINGVVTGTGSSGEIGGAIGYNEANITGLTDSAGNTVAIAVVLNGSVTSVVRDGNGNITSSYNSVGGAIGHTKGNTVSGKITVTIGGTGSVEGGSNVGGVIGYNEGTSITKTLDCTIPVNCMVRGYGNDGRVGGVIGYNNGQLYDVTSVINGTVRSSNGGNVGGAIGYNYNGKITGTVDVTLRGIISSATRNDDGDVITSYDNVGGAIGYSKDNNQTPTNTLNIVAVAMQGTAIVEGADNVGGALGYCENNIESVTSTITGNSKIKGENRIGGAIGWSCAKYGGSSGYWGDDVFNGKCTGRIRNVTAIISADYAISGSGRYIGGVVGQSGDKINNSNFSSCVLVTVTAEINSRYLFDSTKTGTDANEVACIGGVIGILAEGRVDRVVLRGTGGAVNINSENSEIFGTYSYAGPQVSLNNAVLIAAKGQSVGGVVGQIGLDGFTGTDNQNVSLATVDVSEAPQLCVVSLNGADGIGGWIGRGLGRRGGIGNRSNKRTDYNVTNVRLVYSEGSNVGGFCGCSIGYGTNAETYAAYITVTLTDANIIGRSGVGGAFGKLERVYFSGGKIIVTLNGRTNIGDISGNAMPGDNYPYESICYEAGGAIGRFDMQKYGKSFNAPITVNFNSSLSRVYAGGSAPGVDYGVGGVIGSIRDNTTAFNANARLTVETVGDESSNLYIYSRNSNAGGAIGYANNSTLSNYSANSYCYVRNVTVCSDSGAVGGFVGRMENMSNREIRYSYFEGTVIGGSDNAIAGGFVGYMQNGTIQYSYTTATVSNPTGSYTGGFVGNVLNGKIAHSYVGGHTYAGAYLTSNGNISGCNRVGGFAGAVSAGAEISDSYTTASVQGSGDEIGGFIGESSGSCTIKNNYCTGLVIGDGDAVGAFVGYAYNTGRFSETNRAVYPLNSSRTLVGSNNGSEGVNPGNSNIAWANAYSDINSGTRYTGVPFDTSLGTVFPGRAVISNTHHGDWPLITNTGTRNLSEAVIEFVNVEVDETGNPVFVYDPDGLSLDEHIIVSYQGEPLSDDDYVLIYNSEAGVGESSVVVAANPDKEDNDYYGAKTAVYMITEASLASDVVTVSIATGVYDEAGNPVYYGYDTTGALVPMSEDEGGYPAYVYTGAAIDPSVTVRYNSSVLSPNVDYYLTYDRSNIDISLDGFITVTVNGYGNYKDSATTTLRFVIIGIDIADADVSLTDATAEDLVYDGTAKEPGVILRIGGQTRELGTDYDVEYIDNVNQGTATVVITGKGVLRGTYTTTFEITTADNSWDIAPSIDNWVWDGTDVDITKMCSEAVPHFGTPGDVHYEVYTDAACTSRVEDDKVSNAGDYYLKVYVNDGIVTEGGVDHLNYHRLEAILPFTVETYNISVNEDVQIVITPDSYCVEGGNPVEPDQIVVTAVVGGEEKTLKLNTDYTVNCINNTNVGQAIAVISGMGNYSGARRVPYTIRNPIVTFHYQYDDPETTEEITEEVSVLYNKTVEELSVTREGYSFHGWYTDAECTEGNQYKFSTLVVTDVDLYAKWVKQYTVTFVTDTLEGATDIPDVNPITADEGTTIEVPGEVEYVGYHITGWYTDDGSLVTFPFELDQDITLNAKWELNEYTVTFNWQYESNITTATVNHGDAVSEPDQLIHDNYAVYGWYTDQACTSRYDFETPVTDDITLYACWKQLWTVTFNYNDGTDVVSVEVFHGDRIDRPVDPERTGYTFAGWYTESACTNPFEFDSTIEAGYDLYAKWIINTYTVTYISNGEEVYSQTVEYNKSATEPAVPTLLGYTFMGWYTDETLTTAYDFTSLVTDDVTLYAKWSHEISFVTGDEALTIDSIYVSHGTRVDAPAVPPREGYTFEGWYTNPEHTNSFSFPATIEANYVLYANWIKD